jgi:hypothetical protein
VFNFFKKKESEADVAVRVMDEAIEDACTKWLYLNNELGLKNDTPLKDLINIFIDPFEKFARTKYRELENAPDAIILFIVAKGIVKSGTHSQDFVETELGVKFP